MSAENTVLREIWLAVSRTTVLWRINTGKGWVSGGGEVQRLTNGSVIVPFARPIALGLAKPNGDPIVGAHDLIGYTRVTITPDMVGKTIPVFTSFDAKEPGGGRTRKEQAHFAAVIRGEGGISGIARAASVAQTIIRDYLSKKT